MTIRVFVLDDHELVREGLRAILSRERDIEVCGDAGSATDGLRLIERSRPDVALIDLVLPDGDGLEVCRRVRQQRPETACLLLTSYSNDDVLLSAIRAEAAGFLLKRSTGAELVRSVRLVAAGGSLIDPTLTNRLLERLRTGRVQRTDEPIVDSLSPQERRLIDHLALGLSNRQIAHQMELAEKTVKNYVSNVLRKLKMSSRTEAAVFVANLRAVDSGRPTNGDTASVA